MNNSGQHQGRSGGTPFPPLPHGGPGGRLSAPAVQQPVIAQNRNIQISHQQIQRDFRAAPQVQAPHPPANIVPHQLNRVAEQSDLRGENLTEEDYRRFLTEYIFYRFEKVEPHGLTSSSGDQSRGSWANCTRTRLPTVDRQEARKEIDSLNNKDKKKGRSLLEKQRSLAPEQQGQLAKLERDLSNDVHLDGRFQIVLAQVHYTLKPIVEKHESISRRHNNKKRKVREKKKRYEPISITAYFKRCPRPEQVPSLLYRQLEIEKHQRQQLQEQQALQQNMMEQMRVRQENERAEQNRRVAEQQAQQQQQQAQLLKQQNQLQNQQTQLQKQQALQQQQQQTQPKQQQAQPQARALTGTKQQAQPMRPDQEKTMQAQGTNHQAQQAGRSASEHQASPAQANIGRNIDKQVPHVAHGAGHAERGGNIKVYHENEHHAKERVHRRDRSATSSDSDSIYSGDDSASDWDSDTGSEKDTDSTPTSIPSRSSGSYRVGKKDCSSRHRSHKHLSHHGHRSEYRRHRPSHKYRESPHSEGNQDFRVDRHHSRRHSLYDERLPRAYLLTASDRRVPVSVSHAPKREASPVIEFDAIDAIRAQAYQDGRTDQRCEDRTRLAVVAAEGLDAQRYQLPPSSSFASSAVRYEPRTAPRPVIVTEREVPRIRHVTQSEVGRQLDRQHFNDAYGRPLIADREGNLDGRGIEDDYEIVFPDRVPLQRRASFVRIDRDPRTCSRQAISPEDDENWDRVDRVDRGRALDTEWHRGPRSPPPAMTATSYHRNPFTAEDLRPGRLDRMYGLERGPQRLF